MSETRSSRSTKADEPPVDPEAAAEAEKAKRADAGVAALQRVETKLFGG